MPDGALNIVLTGPLADEVRAAAEARGVTPEDYVREQLAGSVAVVDDYDDLSPEADERRLAEPGEDIPLDEAFAEFRALVAELRAQRK